MGKKVTFWQYFRKGWDGRAHSGGRALLFSGALKNASFEKILFD